MTDSTTVAKLTVTQAHDLACRLSDHIKQVIFGQEDLITETVCTFLSCGHILMTGAPGLAKTTLVRVFAEQIQVRFGRIQFTPDLLPSDIIGSEVLNIDQASGKRSFAFVKGPIFASLLLADEINRASPRTQSAMLEAMQERQVTIGGEVHRLPMPFMVFATQNPFESEGTFPLPEAQLDRFLLHSLVAYPAADAELRILQEHALGQLVGSPSSHTAPAALALDAAQINGLLAAARNMPIADELVALIGSLVRSTRPTDPQCPQAIAPLIWYGAGPRAGLSLISASKALALLSGESEVRWRHIVRMAKPVLRHRIRLAVQGEAHVHAEDEIITTLLTSLAENHAKIVKGLS